MSSTELNLKKFSGFGAKISRKISITRSYSFGFPPTFYRENNLKIYTHAVVYYDVEKRVIGIQFLQGKEDGAFKLIKQGVGDKTHATFVARSFFNSYNLNVNEIKGRYKPKTIDQEGIGKIFLIDLKDKKENSIKLESE